MFIFVSMLGCSGTPPEPIVQTEYKVTEVPTLVPCKVKPIEKPVSLVNSLKPEDDLFYKVKVILADLPLRDAYQLKLESAIESCNQSK